MYPLFYNYFPLYVYGLQRVPVPILFKYRYRNTLVDSITISHYIYVSEVQISLCLPLMF